MEASVLQLVSSICMMFPITTCQQLLLQLIKNIYI